MNKGEDFVRNAKGKHGHRSAISNSAWFDLNKKCTVLKLHDMCHNTKCNSQKQITFTTKQFQLQRAGFKNTLKRIFKGSQTAWNNFSKPAVNVAAPITGMVGSTKANNLKIRAATTNILNQISGGKVLSLTDVHGYVLRLKVV